MIEPISSPDDDRIGEYRHVGDPAWLRAQGLFVAEGRLVVERLVAAGRYEVRSLLVTPAALRGLGPEATGAAVYVADPVVLEAVTGFNFHRGCLALVRRPADEGAWTPQPDARLLLALEGVGNPDNVGGLFRVAAAFGADGVLLDPSSGDPFYRKAVRTSMGAVLNLPFARVTPWPDAFAGFRKAGFQVAALTPRPVARPINDLTPEAGRRIIVLVGAEGQGLSEAAMGAADLLIRIPIAPGVDSLNVTVAAGIALSRLAG